MNVKSISLMEWNNKQAGEAAAALKSARSALREGEK